MSIRAAQKQQTRQALIDAALQLSYAKGSFQQVSLREITHLVDIVPAGFYRHYANLDALGLELADHTSIYVRNVFYQMGKMIVEVPDSTPNDRISYLFSTIEQQPEIWHFFITERLCANGALRQAIQREHDYLLHEFTQRIIPLPIMQGLTDTGLITSFSSLYLQAAFHWATQLMALTERYQHHQLIQEKEKLKQCVLKQVYLMFLSVTTTQKPE